MTLKQISELTNLSRATVDRVIHDKPLVSKEAREKVMEVIDKYGYVPNKAGCALATIKKAYKIGVVFYEASVGDVFYNDVLDGIYKAFDQHKDSGMSLIYRTHAEDTPESQCKALVEMAELDVVAIICDPFDSDLTRDAFTALTEKGVHMISVASNIQECERLFFVGNDNYKSGRTASQMMSMLVPNPGTVLLIAGHMDYESHQERLLGIEDHFRENRADLNIERIFDSKNDDDHFYCAVNDYIKKGKRIDGIIIISRGLKGVMKALEENGLSDKTKIGVFDVYKTAKEHLRRGSILFIIDQRPFKQGELVMDYLYEFLVTGQKPAEASTVNSRIIIRENFEH